MTKQREKYKSQLFNFFFVSENLNQDHHESAETNIEQEESAREWALCQLTE